ncbi:peptide chain release factor-like protein [Fretibacter rubidus]|uniref:peptide chain release factor family protein n=1 Tax=Fretibacter rubidus TaxID=570162 RepID=UPI00352A2DF8
MHPTKAIPTRNALLDLDDNALLRHCHQETYRASGPGGQHRNTTDSAVRLSVLDGAVVALCADHRSQHRNKAEALRRLRSAIAIQLRMPVTPGGPLDPALSPQQGAWTLGKKDHRYARFIAGLLDVLAHHDWVIGQSASALDISTGKLIRVLSKDPHAWNAVNQARAKMNLVNLRRP